MKNLIPSVVDVDVSCTSKKAVLKLISTRAAEAFPVIQGDVFDALVTRERLGTTGVGHGVAVPNGIVSGLMVPKTMLFRMAKPVDFESTDDAPIDLVFALLSPTSWVDSERMLALSNMSKLLTSAPIADAIRRADSRAAIVTCLEDAI